ncbi:TonB-dependent receptor [Novosphingobium sp. Chol11]|uniref:TonB-dependent receptor n=1 Tax=Novosphingobium sp. Chol11 TaxID=1385763 RepID=UPI0025D94BCD|nr:TonB-dependent receptor [Novosphingobium sp. Chol11]
MNRGPNSINSSALAVILAIGTPSILAAQPSSPSGPATAPLTAAAPSETVDEEPEIVVVGQRERGVVAGNIKPELQLRAADIRAYGVSSIAELLTALAPQVHGTNSGPPVVLLAGQRISSFAEIRDVPTEAIARVDILPEEVALKYGYAAGQRVVNIVLRQRFRAVTGEFSDIQPTRGGANNPQGEANLLRIQKDSRFTVNLKASQRGALLESGRDIINPAPASPFDPDRQITSLTQSRTLTPATTNASANVVFNQTIFDDVAATINGTIEHTESAALRGLPRLLLIVPPDNPFAQESTPMTLSGFVPGVAPLTQDSQGLKGHLGMTFSSSARKWRWNLTASYDYSALRTQSDAGLDPAALQAALDVNDPAVNPYGLLPPALLLRRPLDRASAISNSGAVDLLVTGSAFKMPAGEVVSSMRIGGQLSTFDNSADRLGIQSRAALSRNIVSGQINLDVPITSRRRGILAAIGDLSLNGNFAAQQISGFGMLTTRGYGLVWAPAEPLSFVLSVTDDDQAPTVQQLGNPLITNLAVPAFDFASVTSVLVSQISGGNAGLLAATAHSFKAEGNWKLLRGSDLTLTATYQRRRTDNAIASFPLATSAVQAAFADRFARNSDGILTQIDTRPVNFARTEDESVRWGINFSKPIKSRQIAPSDARRMFGGGGAPRSGGERAPSGGFGRGGGGGGGFGGGGGRLQFAIYHTWNLKNSALIRPGLPVLDLLNGDATGSNGGQPRHEIEVQAGLSRNGFGARLEANWRSATRINGATGMPQDRLNFADLGTIDLRLFANLGVQPNLIRAHPWLRGTRVTLSVANLFDARQKVTDGDGRTPFTFQPAYLDPIGRTVRISLRKVFY